uniref:G-protein coupled receptors family 1 profile domain-containing protein n=1 Tax=Capra hircus TaxID=9925 RepID=A0A8C2SJL5_CAPHI
MDTNLGNVTGVSEFLLLGLSGYPDLQPLLFGLFLSMYLVTVLGKLLIILAVTFDPYLHTPIYFFLSNLSLADISFNTTTVPKTLVNLQTHSKSITYAGCLSLLLTVMAYDWLVAIYHSLHYLFIMNPRLCGFLVLVSFSIRLLNSQLHYLMMSQVTSVLPCSENSINIILIYFKRTIVSGIPLSGILYSYSQIVSSVLRVSSSGGKYKALSTCGSHLSVVCLFYGTGFGVYLSSAISPSPRKGAVASVRYTVVTPMLNPSTYSLRNKDINSAPWRIISRIA